MTRRGGVVLAACLAASAGPVSAQEELEGCSIYGTVIDAESGEAVVGASVWLERTGAGSELIAGRASSGDGTFVFDVPSCEPVRLRVEMFGFEAVETLIDFAGGAGNYQITVPLPRAPIELEVLRVEIPRSLRLQETGFYARKAWVESTGKDLADFYDPDEVSARSETRHTVPAMALTSRIRFVYKGCMPSVYVDGRLIPGASGNRRRYMERVDRAVRVEDVEGIEIYRSMSAAVPLEFRDFDSTSCGAVVVWTRREP